MERAGWDRNTQIRQEFSFTDGKVQFRGRNITTRGKRRRADYVLFYESNLPLAVVEAKDNNHALGAGMQQGIAYARALDVPFVFSSNGDGFLFHDLTGKSQPVEQSLKLDEFPSPGA